MSPVRERIIIILIAIIALVVVVTVIVRLFGQPHASSRLALANLGTITLVGFRDEN